MMFEHLAKCTRPPKFAFRSTTKSAGGTESYLQYEDPDFKQLLELPEVGSLLLAESEEKKESR